MCSNKCGDQKRFNFDAATLMAVNVIPVPVRLLHQWANQSQITHSQHQMQKYPQKQCAEHTQIRVPPSKKLV